MAFRIELDDECDNALNCRVTISVGEVLIHSPPQSLSDHFRDVEVNRIFLEKRTLITLFMSEKPLLNIEYINDELMKVFFYKRVDYASEKVSSNLPIHCAISSLQRAKDDIFTKLRLQGFSTGHILNQVQHDISSGVYDIYLRKLS